MTNNFFEQLNLQEKKQKMASLIGHATEIGWINSEEKQSYLTKINNDVLTIGVIGQMKAGKSTFLNSFVFEDDILPAATTPMTAALSVITYGPEKKIEAEFYTEQEWQEQQMTARMNADEVTDELQKSKIKAAQELMEKSTKLGNSINCFLGKQQTDSFENLIEYVGADGRYVSITKSVTVYFPMDQLKGVRIVDTPGFNDPIVSREERTKSFLKQADVVLLMLYAGRPFDATDRGILFKNVAECGTGKVLIGINKYDIPYESGETEDDIRKYVKGEIAKASKAMGDQQLNDILRDTEPIPLSAEMALLAELPMAKINNNDVFSFAWKRACDNFEISSQKQMREKSHFDDLISAIIKVIEREKETILFKKPLNAILAKGNNLKSKVEEEIIHKQSEIEMLQAPDEELDEMESRLQRVTHRLNKKIDALGDDLDMTFQEIVRKGSEELEDAVDSCCSQMHTIVDSWGRFSSSNKLAEDLDRAEKFLRTRTLKRISGSITTSAKQKVKRTLDEFFMDTEDMLSKLQMNDEFDPRDFVKGISSKFNFQTDTSLFSFTDDDETDEDYGVFDMIWDVYDGMTWGLAGKLANFIDHNDVANNVHKEITKMQSEFDGRSFLPGIIDTKDKIISEVKEAFIDELLTPLQQQLDEIRLSSIDKVRKLEETQISLKELKTRKEELIGQIETINSMV